VTMELEAVRRLVQERGSDLAFVVNHSGGKDSTRMLGFVRNKFRDSPTYVVMADTGFEHQWPISAADFARQRCAEFGLNLTVVRNPKRTYLEMVERRGMFPSPRFRQCTSDLKRSPIEKFIRTLPHKVIVNCIGIRAEESHSRSRLAPLAVNASLTTRDRTVYNWLPIFDQSLADVLAWHWVNAVRLHPVYVPEYHKDGTTGGYLRRFSCRVCIFSTDADLRAIYENDRVAFEQVSHLETKLGYTMRPGASLVQIVSAQTSTAIEEARQQSFCF
jgi:3'-phosphoadenosine 5'-phosphosulfate sulfotransferase (PAPS reductase)/FAD synthetase